MDIIGERIEGEGSDRKVTRNGRDWRVRIAINNELAAVAPTNGNPDLAVSTIGISISVSALDGESAVAKDESGRLLVFDAHVLTIQPEQRARDDFNPALLINDVIERQVADAEAQLRGATKLANVLGGLIA